MNISDLWKKIKFQTLTYESSVWKHKLRQVKTVINQLLIHNTGHKPFYSICNYKLEFFGCQFIFFIKVIDIYTVVIVRFLSRLYCIQLPLSSYCFTRNMILNRVKNYLPCLFLPYNKVYLIETFVSIYDSILRVHKHTNNLFDRVNLTLIIQGHLFFLGFFFFYLNSV